MGVKNLWDILESCKKTLPLHHLQNKRVCIDLSCWIVQLQNVCKSHSTIKDKVYLRSLFHRLRALLALNCSLIFVTDGSIPAIKLSTYRRRLGSGSEVVRDETISQKVSSLPRNMGSEFSCMIKEAKVLGMALGIPCLDGIEEAEAQCALLNSESLCDGCFTADSDIFLFGAKRIYRDIDLGEGGHVVCYEMVDIERKLGFGRNSLIALALLLGGDYSHGVHGLGQETACQLVKSIGDQVVLQRVASEGLAFAKKTKRTKKQGKVLTGDANKENCLDYAQRVNVNEKESIEEDQFLQVINAYLKPKCHSPDSEAVHRALVYHPLQRTRLQQLCEQFFGWTPDKTDEYIIPKIAERDLRRFANLRSSSASVGLNLPLYEIPVTCPVSSIIKPRKVQGRDYFEVSWKDDVGLKSSIVPADLIESACPEKIIEFMEGKAQGKKEKKNVRTRAKKADKSATVSKVELKLQSLVLDIESEHNVASTTALCSAPVIRDCSTMPRVIDLLNDRTRAKKTDKKAAVSEVDPKLQSLVLNIESEHNVASTTALCSAPVIRDCSTMPQVIDLLSPSPPIRACKISKFQHTIDRQIDVIDLSDSETDVSPEHARRAKELRSFIASID